MPLIKDNSLTKDHWTALPDGLPLAGAVDAIISFKRLEQDWDEISLHNGRIGVLLDNSSDAEALQPYLDRLDLVVLEFPVFNDGRAYSQARIVRSQLGFSGEIRATGDVLPDQAGLMMRCGFDSFEVSGGQSLEVWQRAANSLTLSYQRNYPKVGEKPRHDRSERAANISSQPEAEGIVSAI